MPGQTLREEPQVTALHTAALGGAGVLCGGTWDMTSCPVMAPSRPWIPAPCSSGRGVTGYAVRGTRWGTSGPPAGRVPEAPPGWTSRRPEVVGITAAAPSFPEKTGLCRDRETRAERGPGHPWRRGLTVGEAIDRWSEPRGA